MQYSNKNTAILWWNKIINIKESEKEKHKDFKIEIKEIPISYVAYIRSKGPCTIEEFTVRYCKLISLVEKSNLHITKNAMAIYYDNCIDFEEKEKYEYDIEVCISVSEEKEIDGWLIWRI